MDFSTGGERWCSVVLGGGVEGGGRRGGVCGEGGGDLQEDDQMDSYTTVQPAYNPPLWRVR